ncbi:MAG: DUF4976 domain-containing protein [Spirochaetaceae bacterium]|nr:DUF4976 domain-containing protein [Spirochaetaceae bacterium]
MPPQHRWYAEWSSTPTAFANLVDLAPTLLEQAAAEPLSGADGRSLAPLLAGSTPPDWPDDVFAEFHGYESTLYSARMIRTADWKYVYNPATEDELYDLRSDPGELHNLAAMVAYGHVLRRMKARLVARMRATGDSLASENAWQANSYDLFPSARER